MANKTSVAGRAANKNVDMVARRQHQNDDDDDDGNALRKLMSTLDRAVSKSNKEASDSEVDMTEDLRNICSILDKMKDIIWCVVFIIILTDFPTENK